MCREQIEKILHFVETEMLEPYADSRKRASTAVEELRQKLPELAQLLNTLGDAELVTEKTAQLTEKPHGNFTTLFP